MCSARDRHGSNVAQPMKESYSRPSKLAGSNPRYGIGRTQSREQNAHASYANRPVLGISSAV